MALHSRWVGGALEFYDGTQTVCIIPGSTGTFEFGESGEGMDVMFYGDTTGKSMLWDESADKLIILGTADLGTSCEADAYSVGGVAGCDKSTTGITGLTRLTIVKGIVTVCTTT